MISVVAYKCRTNGNYSDSEDDELEMFETNDNEQEEEEVNPYNPKSSSERYKLKSQLSEQAFI